jgi:hypothetical protein
LQGLQQGKRQENQPFLNNHKSKNRQLKNKNHPSVPLRGWAVNLLPKRGGTHFQLPFLQFTCNQFSRISAAKGSIRVTPSGLVIALLVFP